MKTVNKFILLTAITLVLIMSFSVSAGEINIQMDFAYNGGSNTQGFNFYQESPDGVEKKIAGISPASARSWSGTITVEEGKSLYYITAYGEDWESNRSNAFPFEYIEAQTPGNPPPTIIIRFN